MTRKAQKKFERAILDRFFQGFKAIDPIEIEGRDPPDFKVVTATRTIGIEITQLLVSPRQLAEEALRRDILGAAQSTFSNIDRRSAYVAIQFTSLEGIPKAEAPTIGKDIAKYLHENWDRNAPRWRKTNSRNGPKRLWAIDASRLPTGTASVWWPQLGFWMPKVDVRAIQAALDKKNPDVPDMRLFGYDELWVVMALDTGERAATYRIGSDASGFHVKSDFDRVFLLNWQKSKVVELMS